MISAEGQRRSMESARVQLRRATEIARRVNLYVREIERLTARFRVFVQQERLR
jgi:hypothetical protein